MTSKNSKDNVEDEAILDITSNNDDDESPLLINNVEQISTPNVDTIRVPSISRYRPTNILYIFLFIEFLTVLIIWFAGN